MKLISKNARVSLYLDVRRRLDDGKFPLKLRVYFGRTKLYDTGRSLTIEDYENSYLSVRPKSDYHRKLKIELVAIEANANEVINELRVFTFEKFYKRLFATKRSLTNIVDQYEDYIKELEKNEQTGTSSGYASSIKSIKAFISQGRKNPVTEITFDTITLEFLKNYENWMLNHGNSRTTVGIYLRPLRTIFNRAIENGIIDRELYPFKKYKIPTGRNVKKALEMPELRKLFTADLKGNAFQEKARAFWFFSYQCNGMNIRDISELKFKNIKDTYFSFLRHKTIRTTKEDPKPIIVPITAYVREVMDKYGNSGGKPNDYVFPIFIAGMDAKARHRANQNFVRFINQHMQSLVSDLGMNIKIGTMEARHSFTTQVTRKQGLEFAQESLGHTTLMTTQNYWAGFEHETKREVADMLMNFEEPKSKKNAAPVKRAARRIRV